MATTAASSSNMVIKDQLTGLPQCVQPVSPTELNTQVGLAYLSLVLTTDAYYTTFIVCQNVFCHFVNKVLLLLQ